MAKKIRVMIVSVGGTPAPIIFSLNKARPEYICFFVSKDTMRLVSLKPVNRTDFLNPLNSKNAVSPIFKPVRDGLG